MKTLTRSFLALAILAALGLLAGCGSSSGTTPVGVPISISLSASSTNINEGSSATITATVTGDTTNAGVSWSLSGQGSLSNATTTSVTYNAPATLIDNATVSITATSKADTSVTDSAQINVTGMSITLSASPSTVNAGQTSTITASGVNLSSDVAWTQPTVGSLTNETATTAIYHAPASVTSSQAVTITATSTVNSKVVGTTTVTICPASGCVNNVADIVVNGGPLLTANPPSIYANGAFATATICQPGSTTNCTTVDYLLVDTGSEGLRVLQTALNGLSLTPISINGGTLNDCAVFVDGSFLWGEVASAEVQIAGETASNVPVHVVADPAGGAGYIPTACSGQGADQDSLSLLGANGILGVGPEPTDCEFAGTNYCDGSTTQLATVYYACSGSPLSCQSSNPTVPDGDQVTNPVVDFTTDNNGVVINFPAVGAAEATVSGTLTFGINTQSNNTLPSTATVYELDSSDSFSTTYNGVTSPLSFIDSGSNGYYIPDYNNTITICSSPNQSFFCPSSNLTGQSATTASNVTTASGTVSFEIDNAVNDFNAYPSDAAFGNLGGPNDGNPPTACTGSPGNYTGDCSFDWGLPFFYGRTNGVFTSIDGATVNNVSPPTPWWAY